MRYFFCCNNNPVKIVRVCESETGHCFGGPFELRNFSSGIHVCFSPGEDHILVSDYKHAVVLDIQRGKKSKLTAQGSQTSLPWLFSQDDCLTGYDTWRQSSY